MTTRLTQEQVRRGPKHSRLRGYFATACERHRIYLNRQAREAPPWTNDNTFRQYRFCNVYRELDKVTVWLRERWREPYPDHPNLAFAMVLARLINWPPTLDEIGFPKQWRPDRAVEAIHRRKDAGYKVYTGAYLLGAMPKGADKADYLVFEVLDPVYRSLRLPGTDLRGTLEKAWQFFRGHKGIGDFLAYEIVSDLRHTWYLKNASDVRTWANIGPGAIRGLTRLWGYQPRTRQLSGFTFPQDEAIKAAQYLLEEADQRLPEWMPKWEMREVEHWLCEYDKIERIRLGQGILERFAPKSPDQW